MLCNQYMSVFKHEYNCVHKQSTLHDVDNVKLGSPLKKLFSILSVLSKLSAHTFGTRNGNVVCLKTRNSILPVEVC